MPAILGNNVGYSGSSFYRAEVGWSREDFESYCRVNYDARVYHSTSLYDSTNRGATGGSIGVYSFTNVSFSSGSAATKSLRVSSFTANRSYDSDTWVTLTFWYEDLADGSGGGARSTASASIAIPRRLYGTPSVCGSLSLSRVSTTSLSATWTAPSSWGGSTGSNNRYQLQWSTDPNFSSPSYLTTDSGTLSRTITGLTPGLTYYVRVQAYNTDANNGGGHGTWLTRNLTLLPNQPSAPTSVAVSSITPTSARCTWSGPSSWGGQAGSYGYTLRRGSTTIGAGAPVSSPRDFTGLTPGAAHSFAVYAYNDGGTSSVVTVNFTTLTGVPSTPGTPSMSNLGSSTATAAWSASSTANGGGTITYEWQVSASSSFSSVMRSGTTTGTAVNITGLSAGAPLYFRVRATTAYGDSGWRTSAAFNLPAAPVSRPVVAVTNHGPIGASFTWGQIENWGAATGYWKIKYGTSPTLSGATVVNTSNSTTLSYTIPTTLTPNTIYYASVTPVNSYGEGPESAIVTIDPTAPTVWVRVNDTWRPAVALFYKVSGAWRTAKRFWVNVDGTWR